tara:strand:- start:1083 stop:1268 length:186 start_codon:yes stop_codon:yes gene_type:complete
MAKLIKKFKSGATLWEAEEGDPIYSEGWTIGPVTRPRTVEGEKSKDNGAASLERDSPIKDP